MFSDLLPESEFVVRGWYGGTFHGRRNLRFQRDRRLPAGALVEVSIASEDERAAVRVTHPIGDHLDVATGGDHQRSADYFKIDVPRNLRSLLIKFAWSAGGHHFVELTPDKKTWLPGEVESHQIEPFGDWTFNKVIARAADLLAIKTEKDVFGQLLHEVYKTERERVPRIVTTVVGKAIWAAQHR